MPRATIQRAIEAAKQAADPQPDPRATFFSEKVQPVLAANCWKCHTTEGQEPAAGKLNLTTIAGVLRGGQNGPVVVVGDPAQTKLIQAIRWEIDKLHMPPEKPQLASQDIDILSRWIKDGIVWQGE